MHALAYATSLNTFSLLPSSLTLLPPQGFLDRTRWTKMLHLEASACISSPNTLSFPTFCIHTSFHPKALSSPFHPQLEFSTSCYYHSDYHLVAYYIYLIFCMTTGFDHHSIPLRAQLRQKKYVCLKQGITQRIMKGKDGECSKGRLSVHTFVPGAAAVT